MGGALQGLQRHFNTQPPEGGWLAVLNLWDYQAVSTHSRPKAADDFSQRNFLDEWFQHTAARRRLGIAACRDTGQSVSTHSRPKAAGFSAPAL